MNETYRVLVVDDEEGIREGITRILSKHGFEIVRAENGEKAIAFLKEEFFDIALIDLKMPGISGFDVTKFINEELENRPVTVIVSALATVEAAVDVTRRGAFDFLVKPFTPSDLLEVMKRAVEQRKLIVERETYLLELNSERNYSRQLINQLQEGLVVFNVNGAPVLMNAKAEQLLRRAFSRQLRVADLFSDPTICKSIEDVLQYGFRGKGEGSGYDNRNGAHDKIECSGLQHDVVVHMLEPEQQVLHIRISPSFQQKRLNGVIVLITDITVEKRAEEEKNRFIAALLEVIRDFDPKKNP